MLYLLRILILLVSINFVCAQNVLQLRSPNGFITCKFWINLGVPSYSIAYKSKIIVEPSRLDLTFQGYHFAENLILKKYQINSKTDNYTLVVGKNKTVNEKYNELVVNLENSKKVNIIFRVYNDGMAFRYDFPKQNNWKNYILTDEKSEFKLAGNPQVYTLFLPSFQTSHEGIYTQTTLNQVDELKLLDMPTVFKYSDSLYLAITEAALRNYAGMYLQKNKNGILASQLSPTIGQKDIKVRAILPHKTPWRVIFIGQKIGTILESNLLTNLNEPSKIGNTSWIKPGKATWSWWNGDVIKNVAFGVGLNFETQKYYIDWCAANHIEYHSIIEHGNHSWYKNDGEGFDPPPPNSDVTKAVDSLQMDKLAAYSRSKNVGLRVWVHWKPLSVKLEQAFAQYQKWNIKGLMVDFMDRDDQEMVNWQEKVLKTAAKYQLHVQFHGAYKPTGMVRTYPNELTREGVLNLENLKWSNECDPEHNLMIPFTRMIAGPTDYHAGGFRAVPKAIYKEKFIEPNVMGTRCHHLALYVVYESYLQLVSDYPQAYDGQPGFEFIQTVPTSWDETKILDGQIGDYIVTARRIGKDWYLGAMTDWTARNLTVNLDFLKEGRYEATIFADASNTETNPNNLEKKVRVVSKADSLWLQLASGGGQAIIFRKLP